MNQKSNGTGKFQGKIRLTPGKPWPSPYWRRITGGIGIVSHIQKRDWRLVLDARSIPWRLVRFGHCEHLYVPAMLENLAKHELAAYGRENRENPEKEYCWPLHDAWPLAPVLLLPLVWWHGCQLGWWQVPVFLPNPEQWVELGRLDGAKMLFHHQWQRAATALTLHSGLPHLSGNIFFGAIFISLLARLCGVGMAWLIAIVGGILGNCASVFVHQPDYASVGFSTALFTVVGAIAGIRLSQFSKKALLPLGAAVALLAMLGAEGQNTDYAAHICGMLAGCLLGFLLALARRFHLPQIPQIPACIIALALPASAWFTVFNGASRFLAR